MTEYGAVTLMMTVRRLGFGDLPEGPTDLEFRGLPQGRPIDMKLFTYVYIYIYMSHSLNS